MSAESGAYSVCVGEAGWEAGWSARRHHGKRAPSHLTLRLSGPTDTNTPDSPDQQSSTALLEPGALSLVPQGAGGVMGVLTMHSPVTTVAPQVPGTLVSGS